MANAIQEEMGMENEDWILMQQVAQGKETALRTLYDRFGNLVFRNACQVLGSVSEAEDATQEVFVQIWKTSERYDPTRSKLITWVMLISRRMFIDRLRRRMVRPNSISLDEGLHDIASADTQDNEIKESSAAIRRRMSELPELQREVIERVYLQGYSLREVAEQRNMPVGTIKSALSRGLGRLREKFGMEQSG
ncbi:MAG: sigma-70 family RNA polymerase sigma factor [Planctomycetota bacterium]|jgi:RNA polymerase sigma-70 factor, ECF subfamily|nr:sigma-70 family RNA polymerase sigma factor [Planctomycetota bacterium]